MPLAQHASNDMLILTAVLGVLIGFALMYMAKLGGQLWMRVWGAGLILMSIFMGGVTWWTS
jgi:hypothetical protein